MWAADGRLVDGVASCSSKAQKFRVLDETFGGSSGVSLMGVPLFCQVLAGNSFDRKGKNQGACQGGGGGVFFISGSHESWRCGGWEP